MDLGPVDFGRANDTFKVEMPRIKMASFGGKTL
jgi:hypothetical protein